MRAHPHPAVVVVPECAARCPLVAAVIAERARDHHTSEELERVMQGLPGEDHAPPDRRRGEEET